MSKIQTFNFVLIQCSIILNKYNATFNEFNLERGNVKGNGHIPIEKTKTNYEVQEIAESIKYLEQEKSTADINFNIFISYFTKNFLRVEITK